MRFWLHSDGLVNSLLFVVILAQSPNRAVESTYICTAIFFKGYPPYPPESASFVLCFPGSTPYLPIEAPVDWTGGCRQTVYDLLAALYLDRSPQAGERTLSGMKNQKETLTLSRLY